MANVNWSKSVVTFFAALLCSVCGGCATLEFPNYPSVPAQELKHYESRAGITVGIDPLVESNEARKYFKTDLLQAGILAVYTKLHNGTTSSVLFENAQCSLIGLEPGAEGREVSSDADGVAVATMGVVMFLPAAFIGFKMISDADNIEQNFTIKELGRQTVSPGQSAGGFVYFQLPEAAAERPDHWLMRISPTRIGGGPLPVIEVSFDWSEE